MKQLLKRTKDTRYKLGKFYFHENDNSIIIGKYNGSIFEGSDRLSMSVITDIEKMVNYINKKNKTGYFEGDRFMNKTFITKAKPIIFKIDGDGVAGRKKRGSSQSERQIKSIKTRVSNIKFHNVFKNSTDCFKYLCD
tara:strand:- start:1169 stop:1579 length:411 start_codon:yes stop_codon:yes gene_type:complete